MIKSNLVITSLLGYLIIFWMSNMSMVTQIAEVVRAEDITSHLDSSSVLTLTIPGEEEPVEPVEPITESELRINWYDLQTAAGISVLNKRIDVKKEYQFCINVSSDEGWNKIDFINIMAWFDLGSESTAYNMSGNLGGNLNMFLQYVNTAGTARYRKVWPDKEVTIKEVTETIESDPGGVSGSTECHNLSFSFIPGYQFRYAPGNGGWDKKKNAFNDQWSWNFKISVISGGENISAPRNVEVIDEFGVNSYWEILSAGMPCIQGTPGETASADSNVTVITRSNTNYTLSVDVDPFVHQIHPTMSFSNQTLWVRGGNLSTFNNFTGNRPIFLYGSQRIFFDADDNNVSKITNNIDYKCAIPLAKLSGDYTASMYYRLEGYLKSTP